MNCREYDIVVVGAGPAGLSAARTVARLGFRTLVIERDAEAREMAMPSITSLAPIPGFVSGRRQDDGSLYYPALDLHITPDLILGAPRLQKYVSPSGHEFEVSYAQRDDHPVAMVDKRALLLRMAQQAAAAGAEIYYGLRVAHLIREDGRVQGIETETGESVRAGAVLSAEGVSRALAAEAGVFASHVEPKGYAWVASQDLEAPAVRQGDLGQLVALGHRYTSAAQAFGVVTMAAPGRAQLHYTVFAGEKMRADSASLWRYCDEFRERDPRVRGLLANARVTACSVSEVALRDAPAQVVCKGFVAMGDALTPAGNLGVLPAIYTGRQAALVVAGAIDAGDTSTEGLAPYQQFVQDRMLDSLEADGRVMLALTQLSDEDIDRFCQALGRLSLGAPFFGSWRTIAWETIGWLVNQYPRLVREWDVLAQGLGCPKDLEPPRGTSHSRLPASPDGPKGSEWQRTAT